MKGMSKHDLLVRHDLWDSTVYARYQITKINVEFPSRDVWFDRFFVTKPKILHYYPRDSLPNGSFVPGKLIVSSYSVEIFWSYMGFSITHRGRYIWLGRFPWPWRNFMKCNSSLNRQLKINLFRQSLSQHINMDLIRELCMIYVRSRDIKHGTIQKLSLFEFFNSCISRGIWFPFKR